MGIERKTHRERMTDLKVTQRPINPAATQWRAKQMARRSAR